MIDYYVAIKELLGHMVTMFNLSRNCHMVFLKWLDQFTFPPTVCEGNFFTSLLTLDIICSFDYSHFSDVKWHVIVVLICIFLIAYDVKQLFICVLVVLISSLEACLLIFSDYFFVRLFVF